MPTLAIILDTFIDTLIGHAALAVYLFVIMDERRRERLKKLPALLLSPVAATGVCLLLYRIGALSSLPGYCFSSGVILLLCTLWVKWAWGIGFWKAFAAACMASVFQVAASCLSRMLLQEIELPFSAALFIFWIAVLVTAALLYKLRFGVWFRLLLEESAGQHRTALLLFGLEVVMEAFLLLQNGIQQRFLVHYYLLVVATAALTAGLVVYLARRFDDARKLAAQRDVIAQQQLYERDLEAIRREVRSFRHDYKNLLAGLSWQAGAGEPEGLRRALSELDAGFDLRLGRRIQASTQIGNVQIPEVRSLLLSKLTAMQEKGIECRLEVLYPVVTVGMNVWDYVRCLGILTDNAMEAAQDVEQPWTEIVLLAQDRQLFLHISNPYANDIEPGKMWDNGWSTKGAGRGLGLAGYQHILENYPNVSPRTVWENGVFVQELTVESIL